MNMMILEHTGLLAIYINDNNATYFLSFSVEHVPKKIKKFISNKILRKDIYTIQKFDSIIFRYFYIEYICCMLNNKSLTNLTNLFWPNTREKQKKLVKCFSIGSRTKSLWVRILLQSQSPINTWLFSIIWQRIVTEGWYKSYYLYPEVIETQIKINQN